MKALLADPPKPAATREGPEGETRHNWRRLDRYDIVTTHGMDPGVMYRCRACGHYARSNSVPGPCPPPDGSPKLLD